MIRPCIANTVMKPSTWQLLTLSNLIEPYENRYGNVIETPTETVLETRTTAQEGAEKKLHRHFGCFRLRVL